MEIHVDEADEADNEADEAEETEEEAAAREAHLSTVFGAIELYGPPSGWVLLKESPRGAAHATRCVAHQHTLFPPYGDLL